MRDSALLAKTLLTNINRYLATDADAENLCLKANQYGLAGVVVLPSALVRLEKYRDSTRIGAAISYPSGACPAEAKAEEIRMVDERFGFVDAHYAVMAVGNYLSGAVREAGEEMAALAGATPKPVRLVVETSRFDDRQLTEVCGFARKAGIESLIASACFAPYGMPETTPEEAARVKRAAEGLKVIAFTADSGRRRFDALAAAGADFVMAADIAELL